MLLALVVAGAMVAPTQPHYRPLAVPHGDELLGQITRSDLIVVGRIVAVDHSSSQCGQSGFATVYQPVTYEIEHVLMGRVDRRSIVVGQILVSGGFGEDVESGCLSPDIFRVGARLVLLANSIERDRFKYDAESATDEPSVLLPSRELIHEIKAAITDCVVGRQGETHLEIPTRIPDPVDELRRVTRKEGTSSIDLRGTSGRGFVLGQVYLAGVGLGDDTHVVRVARAPSGTNIAIELEGGPGPGHQTLVGFVGRMCPPRILSPVDTVAADNYHATEFRAASPVWLSDDALAFLGDTGWREAKPWLYLWNVSRGSGRSILLSRPATSLAVRHGHLVALAGDEENSIGSGSDHWHAPTFWAR